MDEQIEQTVRHCSACQQNHASPLKAPLYPFVGPMEDHMLLVIIDAHSKWIEAIGVRLATSAVVIQCLRSVFARFGVPDMVVSDNGTCFVSSEFEHFLEKMASGIPHLPHITLLPTVLMREPFKL